MKYIAPSKQCTGRTNVELTLDIVLALLPPGFAGLVSCTFGKLSSTSVVHGLLTVNVINLSDVYLTNQITIQTTNLSVDFMDDVDVFASGKQNIANNLVLL